MIYDDKSVRQPVGLPRNVGIGLVAVGSRASVIAGSRNDGIGFYCHLLCAAQDCDVRPS